MKLKFLLLYDMELIRLNSKHLGLLSRFLTRESKVSPFKTFDETQIGIAIKAEGALQQVFFVTLTADSAITQIVGKYRDDTYKLFDVLCAICASQTPEIEQHVIEVPMVDRYNFWECFKKSRLGGYYVSRTETETQLDILIKYPI